MNAADRATIAARDAAACMLGDLPPFGPGTMDTAVIRAYDRRVLLAALTEAETLLREARPAVKSLIGAAKSDKAMGRIRHWCDLRDRIDRILGEPSDD